MAQDAGDPQRGSEFSPFSTPWHYRDSIRLCEHVLEAGAAQWDQLGNALMCPGPLCALKWHTLVVEHMRGAIRVPKWYSDWELCVLFVACETGVANHMSKASIFAVMATWMPGRTAAGLKQAFTANFASPDAPADKVPGLLEKHGWPSDLLGLMQLWPGPHEAFKARPAIDDQALAAEIMAKLQEKGPTVSSTSSGRRPSSSAAASGAAAAGGGGRAASLTPPPSPGVTSPAPTVPAAGPQPLRAAQVANLAAGRAASPALMAPTLSPQLLHSSGMLPPLSGRVAGGDGAQQQACGFVFSGPSPLPPVGPHSAFREQRSSSLPAPDRLKWQQQSGGQQGELARTARLAAAAAAAGSSSSGGAALARHEFDLPEDDSPLRQALEQQLDAALLGQLEAGLHSQLVAAAAAGATAQQGDAATARASMDISEGQEEAQAAQFQAGAAVFGLLGPAGFDGVPISSAPAFELPNVSAAMPKRQRLQNGWSSGDDYRLLLQAYTAATTQAASRLSALRVDSPTGYMQQQQQQQQGVPGLGAAAWDPQMLLVAGGGAPCWLGDDAGATGLPEQAPMQMLRPAHSAPAAAGQLQVQQPAGPAMMQQQQLPWQGPIQFQLAEQQLGQQQGLLPSWDVVTTLMQRVQALEEHQHAMQLEIESLKMRLQNL